MNVGEDHESAHNRIKGEKYIMKILVVNCGSSSLKYQLIDMDNDSVLASGKCDRIGGMGINMPFIEYKKGNGQKVKAELELPDHTKAFETVIEYLTDPEIGAIKDLSEINGIGHRIVNGGPKFTKATGMKYKDISKQFLWKMVEKHVFYMQTVFPTIISQKMNL